MTILETSRCTVHRKRGEVTGAAIMKSTAFFLWSCALVLLGTSWMTTAAFSHAEQLISGSNQATGSFSGHVWCNDTQAPARFATVILQHVGSEGASGEALSSEPSFSTITGLNGEFLIQNIPSGKYFVLAWLPGYISPLTQLAREDYFGNTNSDLGRELAEILPHVTVQQGQMSSSDIELDRGAEIGGTVIYDDGTPLIGGTIHVYRRDGHSQALKEVVLGNSFLSVHANDTDSHGRYRVDGFPSGQYILSASLPTRANNNAAIVSNSVTTSISPLTLGALQVYSGGVLRGKSARPTSVSEGDVRSDVNIEIPLSKLHSVAGIVVSERDGHPITQGIIELLYADDLSLVQRAYLGLDERLGTDPGTFRFNYVPNGSYVVRVIGGADRIDMRGREDGGSGPGKNGRDHKYKELDMPLSVDGDTNDVIVHVPEMQGGNKPGK